MHSEFTPSLTRFDVVMVFLRIHLWTAMISLLMSFITGVSYLWSGIGGGVFGYSQTGLSLVPLLVLWIFPSLLASNSLGRTTREPVAALTDLRPLVSRCAGLLLFVQSLGPVVFFSVVALYNLATSSSGSVTRAVFGSMYSGRYMWLSVGQMVVPLVSFLIGFCLAFGPAIRDNFRER